MEIGATLVGQMITFALFVWFTQRVVWPLLLRAMQERQEKIAHGLAEAEKGHRILAKAKEEAQTILDAARESSEEIILGAKNQAQVILEECRAEGEKLREQLVATGQMEVTQTVTAAKKELQEEVAKIVVLGVKTIIGKDVDKNQHQELLTSLANKVTGTR